MFRGYLSVTWTKAQHLEHPRSTEVGIRRQWLTKVITALWTFSMSMWNTRNCILHDHSAASQSITESAVDSHIQQLYNIKESFAVSDQILFDLPLYVRLTHTMRSKQHWLVLVSRYHPTTKSRKIGNQELLTKYFRRQDIFNHSNGNTQTHADLQQLQSTRPAH